MIGATAGRTTLTGEGLQHADGHSLLLVVDQPGRRVVRPRLRLRDRPHRAVGPRPDVRRRAPRSRTSCTTSRSTTSRSCSPPSPRASTSRASCAASTASRESTVQGPKAQLLASGVAVPWILEAQQLLANGLGRVGRCLVGHQLDRAAPRRPRRRRAQLPQPRRRAPVAVPHAEAVGRRAARSSRSRTSCTRCPTRSAPTCPATTRRSAPTASASPTRGRRRGASSRSTDRRSWCARCELLADRGEVDRSLPAQAIEKYRLHDVNAGTTGSAGGES